MREAWFVEGKFLDCVVVGLLARRMACAARRR